MGQSLGCCLGQPDRRCFCVPPPPSELELKEEWAPPPPPPQSKRSTLKADPLLLRIVSPIWEKDAEANHCYACSTAFTMVERRHHCRRCGNVFCQGCSSQRTKLLLFQVREPARVCDECFRQAPRENEFVDLHLPRLRAGTKVRRRGLLASTPGTLQLNREGDTLEFTEDGGVGGGGAGGAKVAIALAHVQDVRASAGITWVLVSLNPANGSWTELQFDASTAREQQEWLSAVREAAARSKMPSVADEVETERKRRKAEVAKRLAMRRAFESAEKRRESNRTKRERLKEKYNYASRREERTKEGDDS